MSNQLKGVPRALTLAVVIMGVLLVFGAAALVGAIILRGHSGAHRLATGAESSEAPAAQVDLLQLDEPAGSHVVAVTPLGGLLAVTLSGGGPDRIVLIDPHLHRVTDRIRLAR